MTCGQASAGEFSTKWIKGREQEGGRTGRGLSKTSLYNLRSRLELHLLPYFAEKPLDAITVEDVDEYRRRKVAAGRLSPSSVNAMITTLAAILEQAVEYDLIAKKAPRSRRNRAAARAPHSPLIKENLRVDPRRPRQRSDLRDGPTRAHRPPPDPAHLLAPEAPPRASASDSNRSSRVRVGHPRAPGPIQRPPRPSKRLASDAPMPRICRRFGEWAIQDSNLGPLPYQRSALTD